MGGNPARRFRSGLRLNGYTVNGGADYKPFAELVCLPFRVQIAQLIRIFVNFSHQHPEQLNHLAAVGQKSSRPRFEPPGLLIVDAGPRNVAFERAHFSPDR